MVNVSEDLTYNFNGIYSQIYLALPNNLKITSANGYCEYIDCDFKHNLTNTPSGKQELVLYGYYYYDTMKAHFDYNVVNVINNIKDASQFYYLLYGPDTSVPTKLSVYLKIPTDFNDTNYFIHSIDYNYVVDKN